MIIGGAMCSRRDAAAIAPGSLQGTRRLSWGSATSLYSNDEGLSPSSLHRFTVGKTSFAETDSTYLDAVDGKITYSGYLIFSDGGGVVDPSPASPTPPASRADWQQVDLVPWIRL